jgi:hypothetical protein
VAANCERSGLGCAAQARASAPALQDFTSLGVHSEAYCPLMTVVGAAYMTFQDTHGNTGGSLEERGIQRSLRRRRCTSYAGAASGGSVK